MKKLLAVILALVMVIGLCACSSGGKKNENGKEASTVEEDKPAIVGTWKSVDLSEAFYTFNEDGTGAYTFYGEDMKFNYTDNGTEVEIKYENADNVSVFAYTIEGKKLSIEDSFGEKTEYEKE